jgi:hypothetical protein
MLQENDMPTPMMLKSGSLALALVLVPALAEAGSKPPSPAQACAADYKALCEGTPRGGGRVRQCLAVNHAKLSTPCRAALKAANSTDY